MTVQAGLAMSAHFLNQVDWMRPWLAPLLPAANPIITASDWRHALNTAAESAGLQNRKGLPIQFVAQDELSAATAYEAFISATGKVPTRDNLHDFFNALVWLTFPLAKAKLNSLQAAEIARAASGHLTAPARGKVRDAATIFDENAALLITDDRELVSSLQNHQWQDAFIERRAAFGGHCDVILFGHALMEKLVAPYKAITAHAWVMAVDAAFFAWSAEEKRRWIDDELARQLAGGLSTGDFTPLPVLGIPGWHDAQDMAFYGDTTVFRPKRIKR